MTFEAERRKQQMMMEHNLAAFPGPAVVTVPAHPFVFITNQVLRQSIHDSDWLTVLDYELTR